jgi:hypothetical protein
MVRTAIFLECDTCKERSEAIDGVLFTFTELRSRLHGEGWLFRKGGRSANQSDTCPACAAKLAFIAGKVA